MLEVVRTLGLASHLRGVEQTPETSFVLSAALRAYPAAQAVHIVRDGRDVVCSLLERGWLGADRAGADDAGLAYGAHARFWVEPERTEEFASASEAKRAAWAWRRYVDRRTSRPRPDARASLRRPRHEPEEGRRRARDVPRPRPGAADQIAVVRLRPFSRALATRPDARATTRRRRGSGRATARPRLPLIRIRRQCGFAALLTYANRSTTPTRATQGHARDSAPARS